MKDSEKYEKGDNLSNYEGTFDLGEGTITFINVEEVDGQARFGWSVSEGLLVHKIAVKAGPGYFVYVYPNGETSDGHLYSPKGSISHITVCYSEEEVEDPKI